MADILTTWISQNGKWDDTESWNNGVPNTVDHIAILRKGQGVAPRTGFPTVAGTEIKTLDIGPGFEHDIGNVGNPLFLRVASKLYHRGRGVLHFKNDVGGNAFKAAFVFDGNAVLEGSLDGGTPLPAYFCATLAVIGGDVSVTGESDVGPFEHVTVGAAREILRRPPVLRLKNNAGGWGGTHATVERGMLELDSDFAFFLQIDVARTGLLRVVRMSTGATGMHIIQTGGRVLFSPQHDQTLDYVSQHGGLLDFTGGIGLKTVTKLVRYGGKLRKDERTTITETIDLTEWR